MSRRRADVVLVENGHFESRARARAAIEAGLVFANGKQVRRPSEELPEDVEIRASAPHPWVSRGGLKLVAALDGFGIDPKGRICLDVGASTGGFTEVLLARGAARVHAIDVGHGQLHARLQHDPRVLAREGTDARQLKPADFVSEAGVVEAPDLIVCDVSFISLALVLPPVLALAAPGAQLAVLVKPQFEAGPGKVNKGVVRDPLVHDAVCAKIRTLVESLGWRCLGLLPSPIEGGDGNREFLLGARRD
ncbi:MULTISPECIES: TlyA family RNA methyltransferase [unclassified Beijerinckia]|uniref:TlyA family RNA methyltransferase n=1 Tax=unclassified Beijerinckia TaxID=2638183 RepID=UPI00089B376A|nr:MULTISPECIES: TlyA family RNA methyltransferase [unclassified Beijerinckia]MDH7797778.1 23S rRNA (cytidine1920-2'-O)/16S rRNA (cytidine1409-2'-O)-methyltransferase [Beijerinckia sp. GAS462]SEC98285.1 23S rRNA (cytidine1920-2'-O)/16S rRNA (cytidine1409-2'-O)-methyltransferase [Beijerinckia sp. 28-YEA-48]